MKDATLRDIYPKNKKITNQLCVYINGSWQFAVPTSPVKQTDYNTVSYYKINKKFGITNSSIKNPAKTVKRGEAGDYLVENASQEYGIMKASEYKRLFPAPLQTSQGGQKTHTVTSAALTNPKFITNIVKENEKPSSNRLNNPTSTTTPQTNTY